MRRYYGRGPLPYFYTLSWLIQQEIEKELNHHNVPYDDDSSIKQLAHKHIQAHGPGPHDVCSKQINVGDRVAASYATRGTLVVGHVTKIGKTVTIKCEKPQDDYYSCNDPQRIIVL